MVNAPVLLTNPLSLQGLACDQIPKAGTSEYNSFIKCVISSGLNIINDSRNWQTGKSYNSGEAKTETRSRRGHQFSFLSDIPAALARTISGKSSKSARKGSGLDDKNKAPVYDEHSASGWHLRHSTHKEFSYEQFRDALLIRHSQQEVEYIHSLSKAEMLGTIESGRVEIWQLFYSLPFPTTNRDFVELLITEELTEDDRKTLGGNVERAFAIFSLPVDDPKFPHAKKYVRGKYVSAEVVAEVKDPETGSKYLEWRMATSSTPGGSIPTSIVESTLPKTIAQDVVMFLNWLRKQGNH
ncbi:hypothetical protein BT69DRAFT_1331081 [Atractiella rhizophila]|nr:hypothetical protein BT69DRAFT_1331081 [Atractiella rhizophila]